MGHFEKILRTFHIYIHKEREKKRIWKGKYDIIFLLCMNSLRVQRLNFYWAFDYRNIIKNLIFYGRIAEIKPYFIAIINSFFLQFLNCDNISKFSLFLLFLFSILLFFEHKISKLNFHQIFIIIKNFHSSNQNC